MNKIFFVLLSVFILTPAVIFATGCPRGIVNDPAPGICGLYVDANRDGYCDLSEPEESINYVESKDYKIIIITIILVAGYLMGLLAVKNKKISFIAHRKFWNWILLILFIPTAITSILLALAIEFRIVINFGLNLSFWHLVFGWAFILVSFFHIFWHATYYSIKKYKDAKN